MHHMPVGSLCYCGMVIRFARARYDLKRPSRNILAALSARAVPADEDETCRRKGWALRKSRSGTFKLMCSGQGARPFEERVAVTCCEQQTIEIS